MKVRYKYIGRDKNGKSRFSITDEQGNVRYTDAKQLNPEDFARLQYFWVLDTEINETLFGVLSSNVPLTVPYQFHSPVQLRELTAVSNAISKEDTFGQQNKSGCARVLSDKRTGLLYSGLSGKIRQRDGIQDRMIRKALQIIADPGQPKHPSIINWLQMSNNRYLEQYELQNSVAEIRPNLQCAESVAVLLFIANTQGLDNLNDCEWMGSSLKVQDGLVQTHRVPNCQQMCLRLYSPSNGPILVPQPPQVPVLTESTNHPYGRLGVQLSLHSSYARDLATAFAARSGHSCAGIARNTDPNISTPERPRRRDELLTPGGVVLRGYTRGDRLAPCFPTPATTPATTPANTPSCLAVPLLHMHTGSGSTLPSSQPVPLLDENNCPHHGVFGRLIVY